MYYDDDIKIAGDNNTQKDNLLNYPQTKDRSKARQLGKVLAEIFSKDASNFKFDGDDDYAMTIERRLLLSFTVTVSLEKYCASDIDSGIAQKSFLDNLKIISPEIYSTSSNTGAFSFYFLAYRRGTETVRRIGQTFAMLCSHDGDSVYQELGEALYCWFSSVVKEKVIELGLDKDE